MPRARRPPQHGVPQQRAVDSTAARIIALFLGIAAIILGAGTHSMSIATHLSNVKFAGGTTVGVFNWAAGFEASKMYGSLFPSTMNITPTDDIFEELDQRAKVTAELSPHITHAHAHTHARARAHTQTHTHTRSAPPARVGTAGCPPLFPL